MREKICRNGRNNWPCLQQSHVLVILGSKLLLTQTNEKLRKKTTNK